MTGPGGPYGFTLPAAVAGERFGTATPSFSVAALQPCAYIVTLAVQLLREDREHHTEFVTISYWESVPSMSRFAGPDPTRIHHLEKDPDYLLELPERVQILRILRAT